jgi:hypothetical protein
MDISNYLHHVEAGHQSTTTATTPLRYQKQMASAHPHLPLQTVIFTQLAALRQMAW